MAASPKLHYQHETSTLPGAYNSAAAVDRSNEVGMAGDWKKWQGRVVNGKFPLQSYLGGSEHSAVFLTQRDGQKAAIKLLAANPETAESQLSRWRLASKLSSPYLLRIFDMGRCRLDSTDLLYVVMEHADEDLSEIVPQRVLAAQETREMLKPVLQGLAYIHGEGCVHGRVKPSNIMAIADEVKLSSDSISASGETLGHEVSVYNAPESAAGTVSSAADVWALGMTLVETMTQRLPDVASFGKATLPAGMPEPFQEIARHCLASDPKDRWSVSRISALLDPALSKDLSRVASPVVAAPALQPQQKSSLKWLYVGALIAAAALAFLLLGRSSKQATSAVEPRAVERQSTPAPAPVPAQPGTEPIPKRNPATPASARALQSAQDQAEPGRGSMQDVVHPVIPSVSRSARNTVTGKVRVRVRVEVDPAGNVTSARFESPGPSKYFSRLAMEAARQWKFVPLPAGAPAGLREWILRFGFGRSDTEVVPARVSH